MELTVAVSTSACTCFVCITFSFLDGPTVADLLYFVDKPSLILAEGLLFILPFHSFIQAVPCYDMFHNNSRAVFNVFGISYYLFAYTLPFSI